MGEAKLVVALVFLVLISRTAEAQKELECGAEAAYLAAIALDCKITSYQGFLAKLPRVGKEGYSLAELGTALKGQGLTVDYRKADAEVIRKVYERNLRETSNTKCLAIVRFDKSHFVLVNGLTDLGFSIISFPNQMLMTREEFMERRQDQFAMYIANGPIPADTSFFGVKWAAIVGVPIFAFLLLFLRNRQRR